MIRPVYLMFCLERLDFKESSYSRLPGKLSLDYKYLYASQIPHNKAINCVYDS